MVLTVRRVGVERLRRVLTKPGVVRVESVGSSDVPRVRQTVGVGGVLVGVPGGRLEDRRVRELEIFPSQSHLVRSHGGAHRVRGRGGGAADARAGVLVVRVVVPQERLGVHTHPGPGPVRQGRVVGGVGGGHVVSVRRDG